MHDASGPHADDGWLTALVRGSRATLNVDYRKIACQRMTSMMAAKTK
jgi:hypothetical protein